MPTDITITNPWSAISSGSTLDYILEAQKGQMSVDETVHLHRYKEREWLTMLTEPYTLPFLPQEQEAEWQL